MLVKLVTPIVILSSVLTVVYISTKDKTIAHDGDTITKASLRLARIDTPELKQTCTVSGSILAIGDKARAKLEQYINESIDSCKITGVDRYNRFLIDCNFNLKLVEDGLAVCYKETDTECKEVEAVARRNRSGLWQCDTVVLPKEFRRNRNKFKE